MFLQAIHGGSSSLTDANSEALDDRYRCLNCAKPKPADNETRAQWLERTILPHEPALRQMLRHKYPAIDADEVIQSTYLRLMTTEQVDHIKDSKQYFFRTAMSAIFDKMRRAQVVQLESVDFDALDWAADEPEMESIIDSRRALEHFDDALRNLPPRQQTVVELRRIDGLGVKPTAERLGLSVSSVEKLQLRAMRQLSAAMAPFRATVRGSIGCSSLDSSRSRGRSA